MSISPKIREYNRVYRKKYAERSGVKEKAKIYNKLYFSDPILGPKRCELRRIRAKKYKNGISMEMKQSRWKAYYSKPEVEERRKIYAAKRWKDPVIRAKVMAQRNKNRERILQIHREYSSRPENVLRRKEGQLKKYYGISVEQYMEKCKEQNGLCAICSKVMKVGFSKDKHIDHDHTKNVVRGILCESCNLLLGHAKDNPEILIKAAEYLKKYL